MGRRRRLVQVSSPGTSRRLADDPFAYRVTKDGRILIDRGGRTVTVVAGRAAEALEAKLRRADTAAVQQLLARATGNYRRGM
jgi:hypothetical protein